MQSAPKSYKEQNYNGLYGVISYILVYNNPNFLYRQTYEHENDMFEKGLGKTLLEFSDDIEPILGGLPMCWRTAKFSYL
jgi:hypothetical protein